jgi:NAD(P)-dependent dehydrogenase (short-subunit alcohol dehydrogenase family)
MTSARIITPLSAESTSAEVITGIDLTGQQAIVTGGSSGIGVETARALAGAGAEVTLAVRDVSAGERTAADITATSGDAAVTLARLDLADQGSVAEFVASWSGPLHQRCTARCRRLRTRRGERRAPLGRVADAARMT